MNEYDSAKMLDVLAEGCNLSVTDDEAEAEALLFGGEHELERRLAQRDAVARSLWNYDDDQINAQLDGLLLIPDIRHAIVNARDGDRCTHAGTSTSR